MNRDSCRAWKASVTRAARPGALQTQARYPSLTLAHVGAMLAREQRLHMRALLDIFPLRINALRAPATKRPTGDAAR